MAVSATDLIPSGNIDGVGIRKIMNFTNVTADKFCMDNGTCGTIADFKAGEADTDTNLGINETGLRNESGNVGLNNDYLTGLFYTQTILDNSNANTRASIVDNRTDHEVSFAHRWSLNATVFQNESGSLGIVDGYFAGLYYFKADTYNKSEIDTKLENVTGYINDEISDLGNITYTKTETDTISENVASTIGPNMTYHNETQSHTNITSGGGYVNGNVSVGNLTVRGGQSIMDEDMEWHHLEKDLTTIDALLHNTGLDRVSSSFVDIGGGDKNLTLTNADGVNLEWNIDRMHYDAGASMMSVTLINGTNASPQANYVTVQASGSLPVLMAEPTYPNGTPHVDVAKVMVGDDGYIISWTPILIRAYEAIYETYERFEETGCLYKTGFDAGADADELNISTGSMRCVLQNINTINTLNLSAGFFWIRSSGVYEWCTDLTCIDEYSDGTAIAADKRFNVVFGVVAVNKTWTGLVAVTQGYPGGGKEYKNANDAEQDKYGVIEYFPPDDNVKAAYTSIARTIVDLDSAEFEQFNSDLYLRFLGGIVTSGGGAPISATTDHGNLDGLSDDDHPQYPLSDSIGNNITGHLADAPHGTILAGDTNLTTNSSTTISLILDNLLSWIQESFYTESEINTINSALGNNTVRTTSAADQDSSKQINKTDSFGGNVTGTYDALFVDYASGVGCDNVGGATSDLCTLVDSDTNIGGDDNLTSNATGSISLILDGLLSWIEETFYTETEVNSLNADIMSGIDGNVSDVRDEATKWNVTATEKAINDTTAISPTRVEVLTTIYTGGSGQITRTNYTISGCAEYENTSAVWTECP